MEGNFSSPNVSKLAKNYSEQPEKEADFTKLKPYEIKEPEEVNLKQESQISFSVVTVSPT